MGLSLKHCSTLDYGPWRRWLLGGAAHTRSCAERVAIQVHFFDDAQEAWQGWQGVGAGLGSRRGRRVKPLTENPIRCRRTRPTLSAVLRAPMDGPALRRASSRMPRTISGGLFASLIIAVSSVWSVGICIRPWSCSCVDGEVHDHRSGIRMPDPCAGKVDTIHCPLNNLRVPRTCGDKPVVPGTGHALRCSYDPHDWICMQIRE